MSYRGCVWLAVIAASCLFWWGVGMIFIQL